ncbi:hypothetical protein HAX54_000214 [Datura stramonium]|uniref:Uncharacterized protein n=1 Tax=Datura stramonium TaxID=4076 RepID=A0ABS8T1R7_DATST|nr:hypothetical protein [Datura stramonium]
MPVAVRGPPVWGKYGGGGGKMLNIDVGNFYGREKYQLKRKSRYKALGHFLDPHFTGASKVKTGGKSTWRRMSVVYLVFYEAPISHRHLVGLHLRFAGVPPVLTTI